MFEYVLLSGLGLEDHVEGERFHLVPRLGFVNLDKWLWLLLELLNYYLTLTMVVFVVVVCHVTIVAFGHWLL